MAAAYNWPPVSGEGSLDDNDDDDDDDDDDAAAWVSNKGHTTTSPNVGRYDGVEILSHVHGRCQRSCPMDI
ncbi:hypothetical protein IAQ61_002041 [Plenodomus lingam]|uniref:uncharacterized protein n=1 Tax=Leptosphaeria maculans TaxID=5022 RepID=UPI003320B348|nr:hypothetical protein IAQ61_002041 [Plenodomus lingam]